MSVAGMNQRKSVPARRLTFSLHAWTQHGRTFRAASRVDAHGRNPRNLMRAFVVQRDQSVHEQAFDPREAGRVGRKANSDASRSWTGAMPTLSFSQAESERNVRENSGFREPMRHQRRVGEGSV
jgi:hypothetical protein